MRVRRPQGTAVDSGPLRDPRSTSPRPGVRPGLNDPRSTKG